MKRRLFSLFLALTLVVGMLPAPAFAQETEPTQVTEAPTEAPATEAPATEAPAAEPTPAPTEALAPETTVAPAPTEAPTEAPATEAPAAEAPAAEPTPAPTEAPVPETTVDPASTEVPAEPASTEDEAVAAVQAMIDALPDVSHMSESYLDALEAAYSAFEALSETQQAQINGVEKLEALFNWVNSQVSTLAEDVTEISGEETWDNRTFATPVKLTRDTTLTLTGTNRIECDQPLDLNGFDLTIQGTGTLELVGKGGSSNVTGATLCDSTWAGSSSSSGGTLTIAGGTVKVSGSQQNAVCVNTLHMTGGNLEARGSRAGIACSALETTSGSLYATGGSYGICMYSPFSYGSAVNELTILVSNKRDADPAEMESADEDAIKYASRGEFGTVYIGEVTGPLFSVKTQKGYLYEGVADQKATFAISAKNVKTDTLNAQWAGDHTGLTESLSTDGMTLTVTTDATVKKGTYNLTVTVTGTDGTPVTKTVTVTVLGAPITVTTQPQDTYARTLDGETWQGDNLDTEVRGTLADGLTGPITYQWKLENDTPLDGFTQPTIKLADLYTANKLTQQADKSWLSSAKVYCTLTVGTYSVNTKTVTMTASTCDYQRVDHVDGSCLQCGEIHRQAPLLVSEEGTYHVVDTSESGTAKVGGFLTGGGIFYLTADVLTRDINAGNNEPVSEDVTLDLQKHTLESLNMGNFPYGSFTLKNGTLNQCVYSNAEGKLILDGVTFGDACWQAANNAYLEITVQGDTVFQKAVSFNYDYKPVHLRGGTFKNGIDLRADQEALALLDEGFAFQNDRGIVDASIPENLSGKTIQVVAHTCKYVNGKCECGRSCDHVGKVNADGYCTVCHALVEAYAIGEDRYTSLEAALDAANAGDTIILRGNFYQGAATVEINKPVTLDLDGHTLTSDADGAPVLRVLAENVTIRNGTVENTRTAKSSPAVAVGKLDAIGGLTVNNVTFIGSSDGNAPQQYALNIQNGHAKVESGTFNGGIYVEGNLTMTGGSTTRLELGSSQGKAELSGGSFDRISIQQRDYAALLAEGYAYQSGTSLVKPGDMDSNTAVQVVKCTHPDGLTAIEACPYCGKKCGHGNIDQTTGLCPDCGYQMAASLTVDGTTTFFDTFPNAATEAKGKTGALLTLLKDEVMDNNDQLILESGEITVDWKGHTLSGQPDRKDSVIILYGAQLTLRDSSGNNAGGIYNRNVEAIDASSGSLTIESGTYANRVRIPVDTATVKTATVKIRGGIFKNDGSPFYNYAIDTEDSRYLAELMAPGYTLALDSKGTNLYDVYANKATPKHTTVYVVPHASHNFDENGKCACGATASARVEAGTESIYYGDFEQAVRKAMDMSGSTVRLLKDVTHSGDSNIYIDSGTFTIDWNGHTLSGSPGNDLMVITDSANVTLRDGSNTNTGGARHTGLGAAVSIAVRSGSVNIQGGTYSPNVRRAERCYGSVRISGGVFENPEDHGRNCALYNASGTLSGMLAPGYTFAYVDDDSLFYVYNVKMSEAYRSVYVVEHPTHKLDDDTDTCACGFHCDHKDVGDDGVCAACGSQMAASVTAGDDGSVTYYRNIAGAIAAATASPDTTVTLLNDIDETISNDGMDFVLDLNGKTLAGLELKGYHFALMDSRQTGTIEQLYSDFHGYTYLKEGWCLVDADGMSLNLLTRLETSDPIRVVHAGVVDIERSEWGTVSYGKQTIPFSLRFRLEDGLNVSSVKVSWTYEVAVREPIGSVQTLTKDEDGFYTFDTSKPLDEHPLNYGRLRAELTHVLLSQIELELEDGQTRRIVLSGYYLRTEKADLSDAVITLDSTALTYAPNPQTAVGQEQTKTVTSVILYGNTLTEGTDYEVTGNVGTNAGTYTLTVKAKADSAFYTGSKTVTWEIKPLHVAVADTSLPGKTYDGTAAAQVPVLTMQSGNDTVVFRENTDYILKKAEFSGPNVGAQMISILIGLTGDAAKNYQLEQNEWVIMSEITPATPEAPTTGTLTVTNGNVTGYTLEDLESLLAPLTDPCTYGTVTYGTPTVKTLDEAYAMTAVIENGALKLNVTGTGNTEGRVAVVTVPVQTSNYRDFTLTVYVEAKNKTVPQVKAVGTTEICYGQKLEESRVLSSQVYEPDSETTVPGSFRWEEPETLLDAGTHPMKMIFTPEDTSKYAQTTAMVNVTVNPRPVTLSGVTVADKIYDGTAEATVKDKGTFSNAVSGDTMDYTVTAVFEDKNVAAGGEKTAYLTVTLNGDTGKNYTLAEDSQKEARARMFPKEVNITGGFTAQDRDYAPDNPSVQIIRGEVTFDKKAEGDDLGAQVSGGTVATPDAGQNKAVTYSATLTGEDKDNYTLGSVPDLTVTIRPIAQTLAFAEADVTKTYGDSPFVNALTHSAGDGQITYTSSDPAVATVGTDGTVTILKSGTAKITAEAGATQNYVKTSASFDLTVDKATGTVRNRNYSLGYLYGDDIPTPERKYFEASSTGAFRYSWSPAAPKNAGNYQLTVTVDEDGNYTSATLVLDVLVEKDVWVRPTLVKAENETIGGKKDGKVTYTDTPALEYRPKRTRGEWIPVAVPAGEESVTVEGLAPGTYEFRRPGDENHFASSPETITIQPGPKLTVTLPSPQTGYTLTADKVELSWHDSVTLTLTLETGYYRTASLAIKAGDRVFTEDKGTYTLTDVEENLTITLEGVEKDEKAPGLALQNWIFGQGAFQGMASRKDWKNISTATAPYYVLSARGNYFTVEASDGETGLASVSYLLSRTALTREALEQAAWEPVPEESLNQVSPVRDHMIQLSLGEWYFYVKAVDKAGNVSYVGSDKLIREENAPTFSGVTKGATYYTTQKVTITDDYALSRYLPPLSRYWKDISGTSYEVTLEGNREETYTMKVEDACQNTGTITVYMKPISALTEDIRDLTEDNVRKSDLSKLNQAEKALEALDTTHATDEEKKEIAGALDNIGKLKTVLEEVTQVEAMIAALPESVEPWDAETEKRVLDTRSAYNAMTDHQKTMVDDSKLRTLEGQLVDYRFTSGENQTWALGCGKELRFTVNGQLAKVKEVRLNGQAVDTEKTAQAKGTDFALKAFDLQVLGVGSYTLQVIFTDGQTPQTQVTVTVSPNYLDLSGYPDFDNEENVTVNGRTYPIGTDGGRYVNLPETGDLLTIYSFKDGTPAGSYTNYPTGMQVFRITRQEGGATAEEITEFANLLNYAGCSIRLTGTKGIRMITGISENARTALTGARGLGGYTLEEYGTVVMRGVGTPTLENSKSHNFAYKKGKADPIFSRVGGMIQYTNVLVGFGLEDCKDTLTLRPYIKLKDMTTGETVTLYGGCVSRSIGYIAKQNENTYQPGTAGYKYVHEIIDAVYGKTEQGGETK